jgi:hypothetical protein
MAHEIMVVVVILLFVAGMGALAYTLFSSVKILPKLDETTKTMGELPGDSQTMFRLGRTYYHSTTVLDNETNMTRSICDTSKTGQIVIIQLIYNTLKVPTLCEVFVDNLFQKKIMPGDVPCTANCSEQETTLLIDIKEQDVYRVHEVQLCCDELCAKRSLAVLCS